MKKTFTLTIAVAFFLTFLHNVKAQCTYIRETSDSITFTYSGGTFASYGCAPIDPNYWISGNGKYVLVNFVHPQAYPSFRVWGMNDDDSASISVNGTPYALNSSTAAYNAKVVCGQSPGPHGVIFSNDKIVGYNNNIDGNFSYQDIQLNMTNITSIKVTGVSGAGWGFAGASVNCTYTPTGLKDAIDDNKIVISPNPAADIIYIRSTQPQPKASVQIVNSNGQILFGDDNFTANIIDIKKLHLPDGLYFLRYSNANNSSVTKFTVQR